MLRKATMLRYILFHHQTTTARLLLCHCGELRYILFHHQTTTRVRQAALTQSCVISSFITKPQPVIFSISLRLGCVISSFITKPQPIVHAERNGRCCVISSFITKPQLGFDQPIRCRVALYPLSSPNHNGHECAMAAAMVALYPLSSPNHNHCADISLS